jgi:predicted ABC-type ATPase
MGTQKESRKEMIEKECFILKGIPGSGKSSVAKSIAGEHGTVHEADTYHYVNGEYKFDPKNIASCHEQCFEDFKRSVLAGTARVIQSNTNTGKWQYKKYMELAEENGYRVIVMTVENHHGNESIHGVPEETLVKMEKDLRKDIQLRYKK